MSCLNVKKSDVFVRNSTLSFSHHSVSLHAQLVESSFYGPRPYLEHPKHQEKTKTLGFLHLKIRFFEGCTPSNRCFFPFPLGFSHFS